MISNKLKNKEFRFIKVKSKSKIPLEKEWVDKNNYQWDDPLLIHWVKNGGNVGILGGYGNLMIVDFDDKEVMKKMLPRLPRTFGVMTGSGGGHLYYLMPDDCSSSKIAGKVDFQGVGKMVVTAPSIHPNGKPYKAVNDCEIKHLFRSELKAAFTEYDSPSGKTKSVAPNVEKKLIALKITVRDIMVKLGYDVNTNPTMCKLGHPSKSQKCFGFSVNKWHCFNCDAGGGPLVLVMKQLKLSLKESINWFEREFNIKLPKLSKKGKDDAIYVSFLEYKGKIYEQLKTGKFMDNEGNEHLELKLNGEVYKPIIGEEVVHEIILLPDKPLSYGSPLEICEEIKVFARKYYDCKEDELLYMVYYILLSWLYERFSSICYLRSLGDWGKGKTRFINVIGKLCYKPLIGSGAVSVAALKRVIMRWKGTMLIDEGDLKGGDETAELVKILNLGYEKDQWTYQCNTNNAENIDWFNPFCPKVISTRKPFGDQALESRCFSHNAKATKRTDIPSDLYDDFKEEQQILRNKLLQFRFDYFLKVDIRKRTQLNFKLEPRMRQVTSSFRILFGNIPELEGDFTKVIKEKEEQMLSDRISSVEGQIMDAVCELIEFGNQDYSELTITSKILETHLEIRGLTAIKIGRKMKGMGIKTSVKSVKYEVENKWVSRNIIVFNDGFFDALERYSQKEKFEEIRQVLNN